MKYLIAPSLLSADLLFLGKEIGDLLAAGVDLLHLDIMDYHYVPNLTFGLPTCKAIAHKFPKAIIDVHLMTKPVDELIVAFAKAGAKRISIHPETSMHVDRSLELIRQLGCLAGIVLNPGSSPECLKWLLHRLDFILVMLVNPGFAGQALIPEVIPKIKWIKERFSQIPIAVDGGVNLTNIAELVDAGASQFIMGSGFFVNKNYAKTIADLRHNFMLANK